MAQLTCLYTTVQCRTSQPRLFAFLGKHGKRLLPYQQYTVPGDLSSVLASKTRTAHFKSYEKAVDSGDLAIIATPSVHLLDKQTADVKVLSLNNGSLGTVNSCWGGYHSSH